MLARGRSDLVAADALDRHHHRREARSRALDCAIGAPSGAGRGSSGRGRGAGSRRASSASTVDPGRTGPSSGAQGRRRTQAALMARASPPTSPVPSPPRADAAASSSSRAAVSSRRRSRPSTSDPARAAVDALARRSGGRALGRRPPLPGAHASRSPPPRGGRCGASRPAERSACSRISAPGPQPSSETSPTRADTSEATPGCADQPGTPRHGANGRRVPDGTAYRPAVPGASRRAVAGAAAAARCGRAWPGVVEDRRRVARSGTIRRRWTSTSPRFHRHGHLKRLGGAPSCWSASRQSDAAAVSGAGSSRPARPDDVRAHSIASGGIRGRRLGGRGGIKASGALPPWSRAARPPARGPAPAWRRLGQAAGGGFWGREAGRGTALRRRGRRRGRGFGRLVARLRRSGRPGGAPEVGSMASGPWAAERRADLGSRAPLGALAERVGERLKLPPHLLGAVEARDDRLRALDQRVAQLGDAPDALRQEGVGVGLGVLDDPPRLLLGNATAHGGRLLRPRGARRLPPPRRR